MNIGKWVSNPNVDDKSNEFNEKTFEMKLDSNLVTKHELLPLRHFTHTAAVYIVMKHSCPSVPESIERYPLIDL